MELRAWLTAAIAGAVMLVPGAVHAEGRARSRPLAESIELRPTRCLERERVAGELARMLGKDELDTRLAIEIAAETDAVVVFWIRRDGVTVAERRLRVVGLPCPRAFALVVLSVGMALEATLLMPVADAPPPPASPRPAQARPWIETDEAPRKHVRRGGPHISLSLDERVLVGLVPRIVVGADVAASVSMTDRILVRAAIMATAPAFVAVEGGGAEVGLAAVEGTACLAFLRGSWGNISACAGPAVGIWRAKGVGFRATDATSIPWAAVLGGFEVHARLTSSVSLRLSALALALIVRPSLTVTPSQGESDTVFQASSAGASLGLGPEVRF